MFSVPEAPPVMLIAAAETSCAPVSAAITARLPSLATPPDAPPLRLIDGALAPVVPRMVWVPVNAWMKAALLLPADPPVMAMLLPGAVNSMSCAAPSDRIVAKLPLLRPNRLLSVPTVVPLLDPPCSVMRPPPLTVMVCTAVGTSLVFITPAAFFFSLAPPLPPRTLRPPLPTVIAWLPPPTKSAKLLFPPAPPCSVMPLARMLWLFKSAMIAAPFPGAWPAPSVSPPPLAPPVKVIWPAPVMDWVPVPA